MVSKCQPKLRKKYLKSLKMYLDSPSVFSLEHLLYYCPLTKNLYSQYSCRLDNVNKYSNMQKVKKNMLTLEKSSWTHKKKRIKSKR